ncbi:hypothetical protein T09_6351 [Trichinella sp. T9]|nr:hypothetical protein T09_6351 [Trichinella sp. T9]
MQVRNKRVCHDFWLCDVMDPKVENPVGFFRVNVVIKLCKTLPKDKGTTERRDPISCNNTIKQTSQLPGDGFQ